MKCEVNEFIVNKVCFHHNDVSIIYDIFVPLTCYFYGFERNGIINKNCILETPNKNRILTFFKKLNIWKM